MKRRLLSLLLAVVMVLGMLPVSAFADDYPFTVEAGGTNVTLETVGTASDDTCGDFTKVNALVPAGTESVAILTDASVDAYAFDSSMWCDSLAATLEPEDGKVNVDISSDYSYLCYNQDTHYHLYFQMVMADGNFFEAYIGSEKITPVAGAQIKGKNSYLLTVPEGTESVTIHFPVAKDYQFYNSKGIYIGAGSTEQQTSYDIPVQDSFCVQDGWAADGADGELDGISVQKAGTFSAEYYIMFAYGTPGDSGDTPDAPAAPFTSIKANGKTLTDTDIVFRNLVDFTNRSGTVYEDMPYYEVKIPQGTENVYVTMPRADFLDPSAGETLDAVTSSTISGYSAAITQNADGTFSMSNPGGPALQATGDNSTYTTVEIPVENYLLKNGTGKAVSPQTRTTFLPVSFFSFSYTDEVIEGACLAVKEDAPTSATVSAGGLYKLPLSQVFSDRDGHGLEFSYDGTTGYDVSNTKVVDGIFYYCAKKEGTYEIKLTATCAQETVTFTMPVVVTPPHPGQPEQYDYEETDKSSVTVYVTFSNDGYPVMGTNGTPISHLEVTVPYFDLGLYGLQGLYRMHTANGQGEYVDSNVVQRPTGLHLYIYLLERYYMGLEESQCCNGTSGVLNYSGATDVFYMDDSLAYSSGNKKAMATSGGKYDLFMTEFWGHDCNLMYFRNHVYPLMSPGWGSVSPYILLSDGDTWDVGTFTSWAFYHTGYYACFNQDVFEADPGDSVTVSTKGWATNMGTNDFENLGSDKLAVALYDSDWNYIEDLSYTDTYSITFDAPEEEGVYYLMALDHNAKDTEKAAIGPGTARLIVGDAGSSGGTVDITEYYQDYDFISIKDDQGNYLVDIKADSAEYYGTKFPIHQVTILEGTENIHVTFPANTGYYQQYTGTYDAEGNTSTGRTMLTVTANEDGTTTVTIPTAGYTDTEEGKGVVVEGGENDYDYNFRYGFDFVTGEITKVQVGTAVSRILLDKYTTTLVYNKEEQKTAELTATVLPAEATGWEIQWTSSDESIATVAPVEGNSTKAVVTAVSAGTATVTAAIGDVKVECAVTSDKYNTAPTVVSGTPSRQKIKTNEKLELDISGWFADEQGDTLTYTAVVKQGTGCTFAGEYKYEGETDIQPEIAEGKCSVTIPNPGVYQLQITANDGIAAKIHGYQLTVVPDDSGKIQLNEGMTLDIYNVAVVGYSTTFEKDYYVEYKGTHDFTLHHIVLSKNTVSGTPHRKMDIILEDGYSWGQYLTGFSRTETFSTKANSGIFAKAADGEVTAHYLVFYTECATHTDSDHNGICERCTLKFAEATDCVDDNNDGTCDTCGKAVESTPDQPEITYGDIDGMNGVDMSDVSLILSYINGEELSETGIMAADVDGLNGVDMSDVSLILQYINGDPDVQLGPNTNE